MNGTTIILIGATTTFARNTVLWHPLNNAVGVRIQSLRDIAKLRTRSSDARIGTCFRVVGAGPNEVCTAALYITKPNTFLGMRICG